MILNSQRNFLTPTYISAGDLCSRQAISLMEDVIAAAHPDSEDEDAQAASELFLVFLPCLVND